MSEWNWITVSTLFLLAFFFLSMVFWVRKDKAKRKGSSQVSTSSNRWFRPDDPLVQDNSFAPVRSPSAYTVREGPLRAAAEPLALRPVGSPTEPMPQLLPDLSIEYTDRNGNKTERSVNVLEFLPDMGGGALRCWCHLRHDERHFFLTGISKCRDPSGKTIELWSFLRERFPEQFRELAKPNDAELLKKLERLRDRRDPPATENQIRALSRLGLGAAAPSLTVRQASAVISAWRYAEGILLPILGTMHGYPGEREIEAELTRLILLDDDLMARAVDWSGRRFSRGTTHATPRPKRDEHFQRVAAEARRLLAARGLLPGSSTSSQTRRGS